MTVVIALRPKTAQGPGIIDEFEARFDKRPMVVAGDGTRRYQVDAEGADVDAFDAKLDAINPDWRDHVTRYGDTPADGDEAG